MPEPTLMRKLFNCTDKKSIMHEVGKLSETETQTALIITLLSWCFGNKSNDKRMQNLNDRITDLEQQVAAQNNE